jgi:hypothetical protein
VSLGGTVQTALHVLHVKTSFPPKYYLELNVSPHSQVKYIPSLNHPVRAAATASISGGFDEYVTNLKVCSLARKSLRDAGSYVDNFVLLPSFSDIDTLFPLAVPLARISTFCRLDIDELLLLSKQKL